MRSRSIPPALRVACGLFSLSGGSSSSLLLRLLLSPALSVALRRCIPLALSVTCGLFSLFSLSGGALQPLLAGSLFPNLLLSSCCGLLLPLALSVTCGLFLASSPFPRLLLLS